MRIGYTTGTFADIHIGHIEFLKACKAKLGKGGMLIVGLTTDRLACKQKRPPLLSYEHRRAILVEFPFVDMVCEHDGDTKPVAQSKHHFTDLFIGDEYFGKEEYKCMEDLCTVHYMPCPTSHRCSSSALDTKRNREIMERFHILRHGVGGLVYLFDTPPNPTVVKTVRITQREKDGPRTSNVYNLPVPPPRNWKRLGEEHRFPNLPGVNGYREIDVQRIIDGRSWCPTTLVKNASPPDIQGVAHAFAEDYRHLNEDKAHASEIWLIYMRYVGLNMIDHLVEHPEDREQIVQQVRIICDELRELDVVHGDIHPYNVCVQRKRGTAVVDGKTEDVGALDVYLIDFGWCQHRSFRMDTEEMAEYDRWLENDLDWDHFVHSLEWFDDAFARKRAQKVKQ